MLTWYSDWFDGAGCFFDDNFFKGLFNELLGLFFFKKATRIIYSDTETSKRLSPGGLTGVF